MGIADILRAEYQIDRTQFLSAVIYDIRTTGESRWTIKGWFYVNHMNRLDERSVTNMCRVMDSEGFKWVKRTHYNGEQELIIKL